MSDGLAARIAEVVADADDDQLATVLDAVRDSVNDQRALRRQLERRAPVSVRDDLLGLFRGQDVATVLVALDAALAVAAVERKRHGRGELVWTGPPTKTLRVRPTRAVVHELVERAVRSITLVTFASHDIKPLIHDLDRARLERQVSVRVVLETREDSAYGTGPDAVKALAYLQYAVPIYRWPGELRGPTGASMHVKCIVRDGEEALISSANLTSAAMDRNMELGLLVRGGHTPRRIEQHFDDLISDGKLRTL